VSTHELESFEENTKGSAQEMIEFVDLAAKGGRLYTNAKGRPKKLRLFQGDRFLWDLLAAK